jgi:hypothetical protein
MFEEFSYFACLRVSTYILSARGIQRLTYKSWSNNTNASKPKASSSWTTSKFSKKMEGKKKLKWKSVRRLNHQHIWKKSNMSPVSKALSNKVPLDTTVDFLSPATNIPLNKTQMKLYNWKTEFLLCLQV